MSSKKLRMVGSSISSMSSFQEERSWDPSFGKAVPELAVRMKYTSWIWYLPDLVPTVCVGRHDDTVGVLPLTERKRKVTRPLNARALCGTVRRQERDDLPRVKAHRLTHWDRRGGHPRDRRGDGREFPWMEGINQLFGKNKNGSKMEAGKSSKSSLELATPL
ncbi:hypothetical protein B0H14DRAFT_2560390 [Mycena olivaceomarginata]|nr:hypothetical protein B0H14DRAFT_2560390 [Mycena olivaceomarginata]